MKCLPSNQSIRLFYIVTLLGFGEGDQGRLEYNSNSDLYSPIIIRDGNNALCHWSGHSAWYQNGSLWTFGHNSYGQLETETIPIEITHKNRGCQCLAGDIGLYHTFFLREWISLVDGQKQCGAIGRRYSSQSK